jgi:eukaryotic-like serine/threonine-protein kinase
MPAPFVEVGVLAQGEIADVLLATLTGRSSELVVVKRLRAALREADEARRLFAREVTIARTLDHPNIVRVVAVGDDAGLPFLAMERLDGVTLEETEKRLRECGRRLHPGVACGIASLVAAALAYTHGLRTFDGHPTPVIHRDISPDNVFLTRAGEVKLLDFGIARVASALRMTKSGLVRGKVAYMSPEQLAGLEVDPRTDLFSLGVVLWEMLVGRHPFRARTVAGTMRAVAEQPVAAPSTSARVPPALDAITMGLLAKFPLGRPPGGQVAELLARLSRELGVQDLAREIGSAVSRD